MPTRRQLARPGMPQIKTYTACSFSSQLFQRSPWFGRFRAKHRLREQDKDNRRGEPFPKKLTGVRGRHLGLQARGCAPTKTPTIVFTPWVAVATVSNRAIHRKGPRIDSTRTSSSKPFPRSTTVFVKLISRGETSALPASAA